MHVGILASGLKDTGSLPPRSHLAGERGQLPFISSLTHAHSPRTVSFGLSPCCSEWWQGFPCCGLVKTPVTSQQERGRLQDMYTHRDKSLLGHSAPSLPRGMRKCNLENLPVWGDVRQKILERRWECLVAHFESYQQLVIIQGTPLTWPAGILWLSSHLFACPLPSCSVRDLLVSSADAIPHTAPWAGSPVLASFNTNVFCDIKFKCLKMWDLHKFPMLSSDRNF